MFCSRTTCIVILPLVEFKNEKNEYKHTNTYIESAAYVCVLLVRGRMRSSDRSGLGESIIRMTDRVLSNMDVTTSRGQCVCSYSFVVSEVLEDTLKPHM